MGEQRKGFWQKLGFAKAEREPRLLPAALMRHMQTSSASLLQAALLDVEQELEKTYEEMRACPAGSQEEDTCLTQIRLLEDQRFDRLSQLHGNQIERYSQGRSPRKR